MIEMFLDALFVRLKSHGAALRERVASIREEFDGYKNIVQHHRLVDVELEVTLRASERDGMIVAEHLDRDHCESLALRGVDLPRHDGGAGFVRRNLQLAETGPRTASIPAHVVGDLHQRAGQRSEHPTHGYHTIMSRKCRELVG